MFFAKPPPDSSNPTYRVRPPVRHSTDTPSAFPQNPLNANGRSGVEQGAKTAKCSMPRSTKYWAASLPTARSSETTVGSPESAKRHWKRSPVGTKGCPSAPLLRKAGYNPAIRAITKLSRNPQINIPSGYRLKTCDRTLHNFCKMSVRGGEMNRNTAKTFGNLFAVGGFFQDFGGGTDRTKGTKEG